ncbi:MAG: putative chromosome segregation protein [crAssphage sp. isolate ctcc615]|uniref:Chromosome segregation protein n=1 Tax=crAssphage sp. isolate ctcc615 TaxID=2989853 RepID=A0A345BP36_9CAUD|nr:MAG: putative chromosome segregation protein [crAssphage sp. isolate ctcc615]AXF52207.1 MAG: putative chromosome segregation protein [crAssphage sp. isolate ctcc615]
MAKKINIPGRLHACTTEQIIAGANEIYDDVLEKKQEEINSELKLAINTNNSKVERCEEKVNTIETKVNETVVNVEDFNRNLNKVKSDIESNKNNIETLQTAQNEQESYINSIKSKVDSQEASINNIKSSISYIHERLDFVEGITAIDPKDEFDSTFKHFWFYIDNSGNRNTSEYKQWISELYFNNKGVETTCASFGNVYPSEFINSKLKVYARKYKSNGGYYEHKQVSSVDYNYFADGTLVNAELNDLDIILRCEIDIYFKYNPNRKFQGYSNFTDCIEVAFELPEGEREIDWFKWSKNTTIAVYEGTANSNSTDKVTYLGSKSRCRPVHGISYKNIISSGSTIINKIFNYDCYRFIILMWMLNYRSFDSEKYCGRGSYIWSIPGGDNAINPRLTGLKDGIGLNDTNGSTCTNCTPFTSDARGGNAVSDRDMMEKYPNEVIQGFGPHVVSTKFMGLENIYGHLWEFIHDLKVMITRRTISDTKVRMLFVSDYVSDFTNSSARIKIIKLDGTVKTVYIKNALDEIDTKVCYAIADIFNNINTLVEIKDNDTPIEEWQHDLMASKLQLTNLALLPIDFTEAINDQYNTNYFDFFNVYIAEQNLIDKNELEEQVVIRGGSGNDARAGLFAIGCIGKTKEQNNITARLIIENYYFEPVDNFS